MSVIVLFSYIISLSLFISIVPSYWSSINYFKFFSTSLVCSSLEKYILWVFQPNLKNHVTPPIPNKQNKFTL